MENAIIPCRKKIYESLKSRDIVWSNKRLVGTLTFKADEDFDKNVIYNEEFPF